jgi:hypothetical protein
MLTKHFVDDPRTNSMPGTHQVDGAKHIVPSVSGIETESPKDEALPCPLRMDAAMPLNLVARSHL